VIAVDVNVIVCFWLGGPHASLAERLMEHDAEWAAPLLWRSEFRNVLAGVLRRGLFDLPSLRRIAADAEGHLLGREYAVPAPEVLDAVAASSCTAYDCEYVVVARELGVPLATTDRQVLNAFPDTAWHPERLLAR
jgi:predicted nucleic acid-binding protein